MKTTLLLLSVISILTCVEAGFSEGFIMGIIMNDLSESKKHHTDRDSSIIKLKNNMMTIDTSLCEFPPQKSYMVKNKSNQTTDDIRRCLLINA